MPFIGNQPALSYTSFAKQDFTTSATTSYTLDHPVTNENEIALFINFVRQEPTTAYTASGTTLTLTSATSASDDMYCVFLGKAVQTVNPPNGSVGASQISDGSIALGKLSATGTKDATTFLRGDNTFGVPPLGGITMFDMWRMTADLNSNADPISANLERVDDVTFAKIGTGMTESSGTFSFPETGLYEVHFNFYGESNADGYNTMIKFTSDNSTYTTVAGQSVGDSSGYNVTGGYGTIFNVTDITNDKVRFSTSGMAGNNNTRMYGDTSQSLTYFQFIRLGDSQ